MACQLGAISRVKLALLCAEAGYGKTTLVLDFLRGWPHPSVWYRLDATDQAITQFAVYLAEGISRHSPEIQPVLHDRLPAENAPDRPSQLRQLLLHGVSLFAQNPLLLVLDNFEAVAPSQEVCTLVSDLLAYSAPALRFVILSRVMPPLPIARLAAQQDVIVLGADDLAFTLEESRELVVRQRGVDITEPQLHNLWERSEGWPAGLAMMVEASKSGSISGVLTEEESRNIPDLLYQYFGHEVFNHQTPRTQDYLVKTSILTRLSPGIVNELLEIDNAGGTLGAMREAGLFVRTVEADAGHVRYHPLFRQYLLQKLHETYGGNQVQQLYRRAATAARRRHQWLDAVDYHSAADAWDEVGEIVEQIGEEFTHRGLLETFRSLLDRVPEEQIDRRPTLLMLRGRFLRQTGRYHEALQDLTRALEGFRRSGDQAAMVLTEHEIGSTHFWLGEFQQAEPVLANALRRVGDDTVLRGWILADLARNCMGSDDLEKAERWAEMAVAASMSASRGRAGRVTLMRALRFHSQALLLQGRVTRGQESAARSVEIGRNEDMGDLQLAWALFMLGQALVLQGSFGEAHRALDEAESLSHGSQPLLASIWTWRGNAYRDAGALARAESEYQRLAREARVELAFLRLLQGRLTEGLRLAEDAFHRSQAWGDLGSRAGCQAVYGIALARATDRHMGIEQLTNALETLRQSNRQQQAASVRWHLARLLMEEERQSEAMKQLEDAVLWACTAGVYHLWWWDPETVARMWPSAIGAGWAPAYLMELARLRLGPKECPFLFGALDVVSGPLRAQVSAVLRTLSRGSAVQTVTTDLLESCKDPTARHHIAEALASGYLKPDQLAHLVKETGLTWKEMEILTLYYLRPNPAGRGYPSRRELAESLAVSEATLKVHIRHLRSKLDLSDRRRGVRLPPVGTPISNNSDG